MPAVGSMDAPGPDDRKIIEPHDRRTEAHRELSLWEADGREEAVGPAALRPLPLIDDLWRYRVKVMIEDINEAFENAFSAKSAPPRPAMVSS